MRRAALAALAVCLLGIAQAQMISDHQAFVFEAQVRAVSLSRPPCAPRVIARVALAGRSPLDLAPSPPSPLEPKR